MLTDEGLASILVAVDHGSTECVGLHAARARRRATRFEALEPIRRGVRARFGASARGSAGGLKLRHDHGRRFVAHDLRAEIAFRGIACSPAFVREPEGILGLDPRTGAGRVIRTLEGNPPWVRRCATVEGLRRALLDLRRCYNATRLVARHGSRTPARVRADQPGARATAA